MLSLGFCLVSCSPAEISILAESEETGRVGYGCERLQLALLEKGYAVSRVEDPGTLQGRIIRVEIEDSLGMKEGFTIKPDGKGLIITGGDASGSMYGCLELVDLLEEKGKMDWEFSRRDAPEMKLRGTAIGMQKTQFLPGRSTYEYPYTPENFPFFYDRDLWLRYLDMLADCRMNSFYLWNGHPFPSLVKLDDYPNAVEVSDEILEKNRDLFDFLTWEAGRRGIWVIQMFYNIIISKPLAEMHGIKTQDRYRPITPFLSDYTRKSIAAFVEEYPNVGLLVCLGEAMSGEENDVAWFTRTILPGVKDGLSVLGIEEEPPVILRGHDSNPRLVMEAALPIYSNLYTMKKYTGESLTTYQPRGPWAEQHRELSRMGSIHIENVHFMSNLEPFRWSSPDFIQKAVIAMHEVHGANGLHLYPQASYWNWPYTADRVPGRLLQIDRDRIWYLAWGRYAWKAGRDREEEIEYWSRQLEAHYGCGSDAGYILEALEEAGEISPKIIRRFGITEGGRQTMSLGMFLDQLVDPYAYGLWENLYLSDGPEGEKIIDYAEKEYLGNAHNGETPVQIADEILVHGALALAAIEKVKAPVPQNNDEFLRLKNDIHCYNALAHVYAAKVKAALHIVSFRYSRNKEDLEKAVPFLQKSLESYRTLVSLTKDHYLYANSLQTGQRRIPVGGNDGRNKTWEELLPLYEMEYQNFLHNLENFDKPDTSGNLPQAPWEPANFQLVEGGELFRVVKNSPVFQGRDNRILEVVPELEGLTGIRFDFDKLVAGSVRLVLDLKEDATILRAYFNSNEPWYLGKPALETDAEAERRGSAEPILRHAMSIQDQPGVDIHAVKYKKGRHEILPGRGCFFVAGVIRQDNRIISRDAFIGQDRSADLSWLFE
jgi:hypothetical protein